MREYRPVTLLTQWFFAAVIAVVLAACAPRASQSPGGSTQAMRNDQPPVDLSKQRMAPLTLRNRCPREVPVFYGDDPKGDAGMFSVLKPHSERAVNFETGDILWIIDEDKKPKDSVMVSGDMKEVEVMTNCMRFITR